MFSFGEYIWIDDVRPAPEGFHWCKTYEEAIKVIDCYASDEYGIYMISFDHDLGEEKSGYDVAKYIVENHIPVQLYRVHSMNPVGVHNITHLLNHYGYKKI